MPGTSASTATSARTFKQSSAQDGLPIWTSPASPGHLHGLTVAANHDVLGALYWSASELNLPALADSSYESAGHGLYTPIKNPADGKPLVDTRVDNLLLRSTRCHGERGFALLTQRSQTLQHTTASPSRIGDFVKAALVLTHFRHRYPPIPC
ncbi:transposase family protein [Paractinoplanes rhizophilus]|uniref:Transposase family protein n=1 Tax=Paractinoplanes rhizophilus TaxID=1416877 RepID=A0ABW2I5P2_9ACTN